MPLTTDTMKSYFDRAYVPPNPRVQRTRSSPSARSSPLTRHPLGGRMYLMALPIAAMVIVVVACASVGLVQVQLKTVSGGPVSGAQVSIGGISATSDSQGLAQVKRVPVGDYSIYVPDAKGLKSCPSRVDVLPSGKASVTVLMRAPIPGTTLIHDDAGKFTEYRTLSYTACPGLPVSGEMQIVGPVVPEQ